MIRMPCRVWECLRDSFFSPDFGFRFASSPSELWSLPAGVGFLSPDSPNIVSFCLLIVELRFYFSASESLSSCLCLQVLSRLIPLSFCRCFSQLAWSFCLLLRSCSFWPFSLRSLAWWCVCSSRLVWCNRFGWADSTRTAGGSRRSA